VVVSSPKAADPNRNPIDAVLSAPPACHIGGSIRGSKLTYSAAKNTHHFISKSKIDKKAITATKTPEELKKLKQLRFDQYVMPDAAKNGPVNLRILVDRASFEIFLNDGVTVLTHSEISELDNKSISISGTDAVIQSMTIHELKSSWRK